MIRRHLIGPTAVNGKPYAPRAVALAWAVKLGPSGLIEPTDPARARLASDPPTQTLMTLHNVAWYRVLRCLSGANSVDQVQPSPSESGPTKTSSTLTASYVPITSIRINKRIPWERLAPGDARIFAAPTEISISALWCEIETGEKGDPFPGPVSRASGVREWVDAGEIQVTDDGVQVLVGPYFSQDFSAVQIEVLGLNNGAPIAVDLLQGSVYGQQAGIGALPRTCTKDLASVPAGETTKTDGTQTAVSVLVSAPPLIYGFAFRGTAHASVRYQILGVRS